MIPGYKDVSCPEFGSKQLLWPLIHLPNRIRLSVLGVESTDILPLLPL